MKRFEAFQGLRAIAFLLVFVSHCTGFISAHSGGHGAIGVEIFIVMSGFLMEIHAKQDQTGLIRQSVSCGKKKVIKFYWLHIVTLILALLPVLLKWVLSVPTVQEVKDSLLKIVANVCLIQSWIPNYKYYFSLNAVSWYLSTSMFMYLLFPLLHRVIKRLRKSGVKYLCLLLLFGFQMLLAAQMQESAYMHYVIYVFPPVRCIDFFVGMLLGSVYKEREQPAKNAGMVICWEIAATAMLTLSILLFNKVPASVGYVVLSAPAAWLLVSVFAYDSGVISKILSCKILIFLGDISLELFMIHQIIIRYWGYVQKVVDLVFHCELPGIISAVCVFGLSVFAAWLLHKLGKRIHPNGMRSRQ